MSSLNDTITDPNSDMFSSDKCVLVAAIDFGTTYSGYAFSFKSAPTEVIFNTNWGSEVGTATVKTPTTILINSAGDLVSFGYKAEQDYAQYCVKGQRARYQLFRHFKMMLFKEKELTRDTKIKSISGKDHSAMDIFSKAIKYFKLHLLQTLKNQNAGDVPANKLIQWVLTIPAIWSDKAKLFMREAAYKAEIITSRDSRQLLFALEPEAASICCRNLQVNHFVEVASEMMEVEFAAGTKYMIIDAGGGTIDITAHQIQEDGNLVELISANGGDWGGNEINKSFEVFLNTVLGQSFIEVYKNECPSQWLDLMINFEKKKLCVNDNTEIIIPLTWSICGKYKQVTGKDIVEVIKRSFNKGVQFWEGDIVITPSAALSFFTPVLENIVKHVKEQLSKDTLEGLRYILLLGGFGDCQLLFNRIKKEFSSPETAVLSPHSASVTIVKGAVLFGHNPSVITARIARKTYGHGCSLPFIEGKHDPMKEFINEEGTKLCKEIFQVHVAKNERIKLNSTRTFRSHPLCSKSDESKASFYCTDSADVMYTDEPGVSKLGTVILPMPLNPGQSRKERTKILTVYFGHTEIMIEIEDKSRPNGKIVNYSIDCL